MPVLQMRMRSTSPLLTFSPPSREVRIVNGRVWRAIIDDLMPADLSSEITFPSGEIPDDH
jgi:hypothetical protein